MCQKDDVISRQAAIDATWFEPSYTDPLNVLTEVRDRLKALPPAQSETAERTAETAQNVSDEDLISRKAAIDAFDGVKVDEENCTEYDIGYNDGIDFAVSRLSVLPSAQPEQRWITCSEKLPEINQTVLLSTTDGEVIVGYRYKPDIVWQVTSNDGRKIWVYDPENYPGNIDELPKAETCGFENRDNCWLSVTSINYDLKFAGISAWMPLPEPYKEDDHETD